MVILQIKKKTTIASYLKQLSTKIPGHVALEIWSWLGTHTDMCSIWSIYINVSEPVRSCVVQMHVVISVKVCRLMKRICRGFFYCCLRWDVSTFLYISIFFFGVPLLHHAFWWLLLLHVWTYLHLEKIKYTFLYIQVV